ncbi:CoA transferase [Paracoccaceae bacterium]|nr:CoA transferase [Paracoccaceae bacterium]
MNLPLDGILVISMEQAVAGPFCSNRLRLAGARVIKIERMDSGDFARGYDTAAGGESSYFIWLNQGKESIALDLKTKSDRHIFLNMIAEADIFIQNFSPTTVTKLSIDSSTLKAINPRLICCDISGYGEAPEMMMKKSYDLLIQAESGLIDVSGSPEGLGRIGVSICDIGAGMAAHAGIVESLLLKERFNKIKDVKISLFDVAADWMTVPYIHSKYGGAAPKRVGLKHPSIAPYGAFLCSENTSFIIAIQNDLEWKRFCVEVLKLRTLSKENKFSSNTLRVRNRGLLDEKIQSILSSLTDETLKNRLEEASIAYGRLNTVKDLERHLALKKISVRNSLDDSLTIPSPPLIWENSEKKAPKFNQHNEQLRKEFNDTKK